jgi:hypothetical protein
MTGWFRIPVGVKTIEAGRWVVFSGENIWVGLCKNGLKRVDRLNRMCGISHRRWVNLERLGCYWIWAGGMGFGPRR